MRDTTADATIDGGANRTATPGDRAQIDTALDGPNTTDIETFLPKQRRLSAE